VPWPGPTADVRLRVGHAAGVLFALILLIAACIRDETLLALQQRQQREVGISSLNQQLYCFLEANPGVETVATDYQAMRWLPELGARGVICTCHELSAFRHTFDRPEIRHILIRRKGAAPEVREFLNSRAGVRLVFEDHGFEFYEKRAGQAICRLPVSCNN
jgi:hypothetical protein